MWKTLFDKDNNKIANLGYVVIETKWSTRPSTSQNKNKQTNKKRERERERTKRKVDFAVLEDHRVKLSVVEKRDKYLDLARELKTKKNCGASRWRWYQS